MNKHMYAIHRREFLQRMILCADESRADSP